MAVVRRLGTLCGLALISALAPAPAGAEAAFRPCAGLDGVSCATVKVPVDRSGGVAGTIDLRVERVRAFERSRGGAPIVALAGGPGQAATPFTEAFATLLEPVLDDHDLVVFDQRGTGRSGLLRCPGLERVLQPESSRTPMGPLTRAVEDCAETLGPRRSFYTTRESVEDIEAVRQELGVERISLYGVSYGTKVALAYAAAHPDRVERLVLDSVVEAQGPDPFSRETLQATPRVLRDLCRPSCRGITTDPAGDLSRLVATLAEGPLRGYRVGADGRRKPAALGRTDLLDFLLAGDFAPTVRALVPGAVQGALRGDLAPILRLTGGGGGQTEREPPRLFSPALFTATLCEDVDFPWTRGAPREQRLAEARQRADELPDEAFFPFDRPTALEGGIIDLCAAWPQAPDSPLPVTDAPPPDVPTLLLSGERDLRTPLESARRAADRLPKSAVLAVPDAGHSVLGQSFDECPERTLRRFFLRGAQSARCRVGASVPPPPVPPETLSQVPSARGSSGQRGRTLAAAALTVDDVFLASVFGTAGDGLNVRGGGLRGGRFYLRVQRVRGRRATTEGRRSRPVEQVLTLRLDRAVYVTGVRVSGDLRFNDEFELRGRLVVDGPAASRGRLTISSTRSGFRVSGRLGGRRVRGRVRSALS